MLCADENFFPWIDICAIQINKYYYYYYIIIAFISFFKYILQRKLVSFLSMSRIAVLSKRLRSIKVPDVITWCPRSLADHGTWKGKYVSA